MKGQTQAVTAVLITSVVVGSVATAYVWGTPLLEKRQGQADLAEMERGVFTLYERINDVSQSGAGTTERVEIGSSGSSMDLRINEEQDYIEITTNAQQPPYPLDTWTLVRGRSMQNLTFGTGDYGIQGEDQPGVVGVRPVGGAGNTVLTYRIEFRNLYVETPTGARLSKVDLQAEGRSRTTESATILISNEGTQLDAGSDQVTLSNGESLDRSRTVVTLDIR